MISLQEVATLKRMRKRSRHSSGEGHYRAVLTDAQVREMRDLYAGWKDAGVPKGYGALAKLYGCGAATARDICKLRTRAG